MSTACNIELDSCLPDGKVTIKSKFQTSNSGSHTKNITEYLSVGTVKIPIRLRTRKFSASVTNGMQNNDFIFIYDLFGNLQSCAGSSSKNSITISEDATATDSTIFILNPETNDCFWREDKYSISFSGTSNAVALFSPAFAANKIKFDAVSVILTQTWKLMIGGVVETLKTTTGSKPIYSAGNPLIILLPVPFGGKCVDPEVIKYGFYDFLVDGVAEADGGYDFYYAEWLRDHLGTYKDADKADAAERWNDTQGVDAIHKNQTRIVPMPTIYGADDPRGSITRDKYGNVLASVSVGVGDTMQHFNRFVDKDNKAIIIPDTIGGSNLRLYPIGLI